MLRLNPWGWGKVFYFLFLILIMKHAAAARDNNYIANVEPTCMMSSWYHSRAEVTHPRPRVTKQGVHGLTRNYFVWPLLCIMFQLALYNYKIMHASYNTITFCLGVTCSSVKLLIYSI